MLTKQKFVDLINFIKIKQDQENLLCSTLETICPGEYINTFIFNEYEAQLITVIKAALNLSETNNDIEYFIYDLEFGTAYKDGSLSVNNKSIDISTADKLYDYLVTITD